MITYNLINFILYPELTNIIYIITMQTKKNIDPKHIEWSQFPDDSQNKVQRPSTSSTQMVNKPSLQKQKSKLNKTTLGAMSDTYNCSDSKTTPALKSIQGD